MCKAQYLQESLYGQLDWVEELLWKFGISEAFAEDEYATKETGPDDEAVYRHACQMTAVMGCVCEARQSGTGSVILPTQQEHHGRPRHPLNFSSCNKCNVRLAAPSSLPHRGCLTVSSLDVELIWRAAQASASCSKAGV